MGPVSLYCRGLGEEREEGCGTLRGESGSTCDITILMTGTRESTVMAECQSAVTRCIVWGWNGGQRHLLW